MPVLRTCLVCSATFSTHQSEIRRGDGKYCSRKCYQQDRLGPLPDRFWSLVLKTEGDECWLWQGSRTTTGYGRFSIQDKHYQAHRIAYELTFGMILCSDIFVCHRCDTPLCMRPDHLFLGTNQDNLRDMSRKGRSGAHVHPETLARGDRSGSRMHPESRLRGEQNPSAKLTGEKVREIRRLRATEQWSQYRLAAFFGISRPVIGAILRGKTWKHIL